jgi:hypothetical protein
MTANEQMTANFLNGIASDLGTTSSFVTGNTYGFDDLNNIIKNAMGKGVTTAGSKCEVIKVSDQVKITEGTIVFDSGATLKISSSGLFLNYVSGVKNYIYGINNIITNKIYAETSETIPTGDFVMLAEIGVDGVLTDKRVTCVATVNFPTMADTRMETFDLSFTGVVPTTITKSIPISNIKKLLIDLGNNDTYESITTYNVSAETFNYFCRYSSSSVYSGKNSSEAIIYYASNGDHVKLTLTISQTETELILSFTLTDDGAYSPSAISFEIPVTIFGGLL